MPMGYAQIGTKFKQDSSHDNGNSSFHHATIITIDDHIGQNMQCDMKLKTFKIKNFFKKNYE
jgi:hypothetical protein